MLTGFLSNDGVSINLSGDFSDLEILQKTIAKIMSLIDDHNLSNTDISSLFESFSNKIMKECAKTSLHNDPQTNSSVLLHHYCFTCNWVDIVFISNLLVSLSDYIVMDELDAINILLLEYILKDVMNNINPKGPMKIREFISKRFVFSNLKSFLKNFSYDKAVRYEPLTKNSLIIYSNEDTQ